MAETRHGADLEAQHNYPMARVISPDGAPQDPVLDAQIAAEMQTIDKMERSIRHAFARKVFGLLGMQITVMMAFIALFLYVPQIRAYANSSSSAWLTAISGFLFLISIITLSCNPGFNKQYPKNIIGLLFVGAIGGVFIGSLVSNRNPDYVWIAFAAAIGLMIVLGLFACQTRYDFTGIGPYLCVGIMLLFVFSVFGGISPVFRSDWTNGVRTILFLALAVLLFSMYVVYDVQLVLGGKHSRLQFGVDDYVVATISLFTDFLLIFGVILGLSGNN